MIEILEALGQHGMTGIFIAYLIWQGKQTQKNNDKCHKTLNQITGAVERLNERVDSQTEVLSAKIDSKK